MFETSDNKSFSKKTAREKFSVLGHLVYLIFLALVITSLMVLYIDPLPSSIREGAIATQDIKADQNYELTDEKSTKKLREEAAEAVHPIYDFDQNLLEHYKQTLKEAFSAGRQVLQQAELVDKKIDFNNEVESGLRQNFQVRLGLALPDNDYLAIRKDFFSADLEQVLIALLEPVERQWIVHDKQEISIHKEQGIVLRKSDEEIIMDDQKILSRQEAQDFYSKSSVGDIKKQFYLDFIDVEKVKLALKLFPQFVKISLRYNKTEAEARKEKARASIQNIIYKLQKGQIIIRRGDRYEPWHISVLQAIREARLQTNVTLKFLGVLLLSLIALFSLYFFAHRHVKRFIHNKKDLYFLGLMVVGFVAFLRLATFVATNLQDALPLFGGDIRTFYYMIPIAAAAMIVRFILNAETALIYNVILAFFAGIFLENNLELALYYFISGMVAAHLIARVERRSSVFRCGFYVGLINIALVLGLNLIQMSSPIALDYELFAVNSLAAFLGGMFCSLVMLAISPLLETVFNYTTNIQLLELANMNHPLLREMIVRSPGTYHHSQLVGLLAEAGARAIDANPLLARVGSYYHDIGKMKKPQYFIENQRGGDNPHDTLTPSMSALIISAHVKDGLEMAREYKLPQVITDFIPEHQGTKLIGYFFNKAKKMAGPNDPKVDERIFRYEGPKPQTLESGIVMLADTSEAAVRSLPEKLPSKIQSTVEKLVNAHFVDGQLDECDVTLKDLHLIIEAFVKILIAMYHQRVEYPEEKFKMLIQVAKDHDDQKDSHHQQSPLLNNISSLFKK